MKVWCIPETTGCFIFFQSLIPLIKLSLASFRLALDKNQTIIENLTLKETGFLYLLNKQMGFMYMMSMCVSTLDITEREMQVLLTRIMDIRHCTKFLDSCFFLLQIILSFPILTLSENLLCTASDHTFPLPLAVFCLHQCLFLVFLNTGLS